MQNWHQYKQQLSTNRHRGLVVISGDLNWCLSQVSANETQLTLWLGDNSLPNTTELKGKQAQQWLGQECEQLVINCHYALNTNGLDLNAIGALSGTLKAGGICYLLCPAFSDWPRLLPNRLTIHLIDTIQAHNNLIQLEQGSDTKLAPTNIKPQTKPQNTFNHSIYKTEQQQTAVEKIKRVALGHRRRPLVLTADRGRGKSSALGIALAELLIEGKQKIIISAPRVASVHAVFARAVALLDVIKQSATQLITEQGTVQFMPPDELIRLNPSADLVMIDEAAAIPAPMLTQMVNQHSRIVFTSTIAGYEGTGRGFEIRFKQTLNQLTPNWQAYSMDQPIRWADNDPLERFINQALMLNAQAAHLAPTNSQISKSELKFTFWDRDKLLDDNQSLSQIIGLLTLSHYKTSPNDFKHLLDGLDAELYTLSNVNGIVATALVAIEGHLPDDLSQQIWQGERRPKGHLLPQTLSCHAGFVDAPKYSYARVVRIAVHPDIHCKGIGSQLLDQLTAHIKKQGIDFVGSSFGATSRLLHFWHNNGFAAVRLGLTIEATSNEYSAVVLKTLSSTAKHLQWTIQRKFDHELPQQLIEFYWLLPAALVIRLLQQQKIENLQELTTQECADVDCYVNHKREYEFASVALYKLTLLMVAKGQAALLSELQQQLLVAKILRKQSWPVICDELRFTGKKAAIVALKQVFGIFKEM